ncbi:MAG: hypothetical protein U9R79_17710 [Armatimonadota bacterium]|nr:hypothetical protein [Armatimonadota bacterium]
MNKFMHAMCGTRRVFVDLIADEVDRYSAASTTRGTARSRLSVSASADIGVNEEDVMIAVSRELLDVLSKLIGVLCLVLDSKQHRLLDTLSVFLYP